MLTNQQIHRIFEIAEEAKQLGSYAIANSCFAILFDTSLDTTKIWYSVEIPAGDNIEYIQHFYAKKDSTTYLYTDAWYYSLAVISFCNKNLNIPLPLLQYASGSTIVNECAERQTSIKEKVAHNRVHRHFVKERELELAIDWLKLQLEAIVPAKQIHDLCAKYLAQTCRECPYYLASSDLCLAGYPTKELAENKCTLWYYNDSRKAFHIATGRAA